MSKPSPTARPLTGYTLEGQFRKLRSRWQFTPLEHYVFSELIALCNEEGWPAEFSATNATLIAGVGCSEPGLIKARKRLAAAGLLTYTEGKRRCPTAYRFYPTKGLTEFSDSQPEHLTEGITEFSVEESKTGEHLTQGLTEGLTEFSPYKEQTKTKITLSESVGVSAQNLASPASEQPAAPLATAGSSTPSPAPDSAESTSPPTPQANRRRKRDTPAAPAETLPASCPLADLLNPGGLAAKVQQMSEPLTPAQAERLVHDYGAPVVREILCEMANYRKLLTASDSANLTARNWLTRRGLKPGTHQPPATLPTPAAAEEEALDEPARLFRAQLAAEAKERQRAHLARWSANA